MAGEGHGGREGEGWGRDGWEEREGMGEGVAMRHTFNQRAEDAEELGPQEGGPLGGEGLDPSPRALEARTTHKSTSRRCSRIWDPFGSQIDGRRIEHLLIERRSDPEADLLMPQARRHAT